VAAFEQEAFDCRHGERHYPQHVDLVAMECHNDRSKVHSGRQYSTGRSSAWRWCSQSSQEAGAETEVNLGIDAPDADIEEGVQSMLMSLRKPGDPESMEIVSTDPLTIMSKSLA